MKNKILNTKIELLQVGDKLPYFSEINKVIDLKPIHWESGRNEYEITFVSDYYKRKTIVSSYPITAIYKTYIVVSNNYHDYKLRKKDIKLISDHLIFSFHSKYNRYVKNEN